MAKIIRLGVLALAFISLLMCSRVSAENLTNELQQGRYVLIMMTGRAIINTRIPALVLDSPAGRWWLEFR